MPSENQENAKFSTDNIGLHLKNIFKEGELPKKSVTEKISATAADGKNYLTKFYNLDAVIAGAGNETHGTHHERTKTVK